jgi:hypothetical protein
MIKYRETFNVTYLQGQYFPNIPSKVTFIESDLQGRLWRRGKNHDVIMRKKIRFIGVRYIVVSLYVAFLQQYLTAGTMDERKRKLLHQLTRSTVAFAISLHNRFLNLVYYLSF